MAAGGLNFTNIQSVIPSVQPGSAGVGNRAPATNQPDFREALRQVEPSAAKPATSAASSLKFSNHAIERMQMRGIHFDPAKMESIQQAISKAASKGAKNTLVLTDDSALIVSVKDNTVVTVMDKNSMKENVFTNIDSTVLV
jgi:flagellar operon protein